MNEAIAYVARFGCIDAAHYTWINLIWEKATGHDKAYLDKLLLDHGDYATPLRSEDLKMPFENMAIVWTNTEAYKDAPRYEHSLMVVSCVDSKPKHVDLWLDNGLGSFQIGVSVLVRPTPEERERAIREAKAQNKNFKDYGGTPEEQSLIRTAQWLPLKLQADCVELMGVMVQKGFRYIAAASDGLLAGEQIDYHKATGNPSNAKRIKKGKAPLYEWRTVQLERKAPELPAAPQGGTHASPRLHQRRGHWATSKLGKKYWRRETVVGKPENGMIFHDYTSGETNHV